MRTLAWATLALALASSLAAAAVIMPIPGKMLVNGWDSTSTVEFILEGTTETQIPAPAQFFNGDLTPDGTQVVYSDRESDTLGHIWKSNLDGSAAANLTAAAGLTGVNCYPRWSPDGSRIVFQHSEPAAGQQPCDAHFAVWMMNADGSGAHAVIAPGFEPASYPSFTPDGAGLLCESPDGILLMNLDGTGAHVVPNVGATPTFSPDGSRIVSSTTEYNAAQAGTYRRLVVTNVDGSSPLVLVERFITDADVADHLTHLGEPVTIENADGLIGNIGPVEPAWAPTGGYIAFSAAMPLQVQGIDYDLQRELWIYDLSISAPLQIMTDNRAESGFSWRGNNTYSGYNRVTVDNTTVAFAQVVTPGLTTILLEPSPPALPATYQPVGASFRLHTTAGVVGPATVDMTFSPAEVPVAAQGHLAVLRYNEGTARWEDITIARNSVLDLIEGQTPALGLVALAWPLPPSHFSDVSSSLTDPYWALWEIETTYAAGIVSGYPGGFYAPTDPVTRDQMAVYIARAVAGGDDMVPAGPSVATFTDVPTTSWAFDYVEYVKRLGIVAGYSSTSYAPAVPVDRGQMAVFIARAIANPIGEAGLAGYTPPATPSFPDVPTSSWARKYVEYIRSKGITGGYPDGLYHPEIVVTRDQIAVYVARAFDLIP